jgi:hypothetical protein
VARDEAGPAGLAVRAAASLAAKSAAIEGNVHDEGATACV